jgi:nucleoside-diphosphate-sugar epimerase
LKKIFITGATGYIGNALITEFAGKYSFRAYGRSKPNLPAEYCKGDINNLEEVIKASSEMDAIIHAAALTTDNPDIVDAEYIKTNIVGTYNILEAALKNNIKKVVFLSSVCAVGFRDHSLPVREDEKCNPTQGMYGFSKMAGEELCKYYSERYDMRVLCVRPAIVIPQHEFIAPPKGAVPWISFVDIEDVLQEISLALENETIKYGIFHAAPDSKFSTFDVSIAKKVLGYKPKHNFETETRPDFIASLKFRIRKFLNGERK